MAPAAPGQELATFSRLFRQGVELAARVNDPETPQQRAAAARTALLRLQRAAAVIPGLSPERRDKARFWVQVWRAEVHWRHGTRKARRLAVETALAARREARAAGVYNTYYRVQCLIILWRCMGYAAFEELVDDPAYGDRGYLFGDRPLEDLERKKATDLVLPLRLMRCDLRLLEDELSAVEELRQIAKELREADDPDLVEWRRLCLKMLARHYMELRDWGRALLFVDQLPKDSTDTKKAQIRIARIRHDWDTVIRLGNDLGAGDDTYLFVAEAREAKGQYRQALEVVSEVLRKPDLRPETRAAALDQQADCRLKLAKQTGTGESERGMLLEAAEQDLARAWDVLAGKGSYQARAERAEIRKDQGLLLEELDRPEAAFLKYQESIQLLEEVRAGTPLDHLGGTGLLGQDPEHLAAVDGVLRTWEDAGYGITEALVLMDRLKSRGLLDWLAQPPSRASLARYRRALRDVALGGGLDVLEELGAARGGQRRGQAILGSLEMNSLLHAFPETCFLCYWAGEQQVYLLVVTTGREGTRRLVGLGERGRALRLVGEAYAKVSTPESHPWPDLDAAAEFFLPEAVRPLLAAVQRVVVCPAPELYRLPFAALRVEGRALGAHKELSTAPSLAVLRELSARPPAGSGLVLVHSATPPPAQARLLHLGPLRFSQHEAELVAANYPVLAVRKGQEATFENLREDLGAHAGRVGVVHLSAHAVEHVAVPSRSLLMLSDGPADMAAMANLKLGGSVVVLSNCFSKGSAARGGEGVSGLTWGPLAAGARAVVASQWAVNQQATADLMGQFHYFRGRGHSDAEAMRRARQRLAAAENYRHPYYWAGFDVVASSRVPQASARWSYWWLLAVAGFLAGSWLLLWRVRRAAVG